MDVANMDVAEYVSGYFSSPTVELGQSARPDIAIPLNRSAPQPTPLSPTIPELLTLPDYAARPVVGPHDFPNTMTAYAATPSGLAAVMDAGLGGMDSDGSHYRIPRASVASAALTGASATCPSGSTGKTARIAMKGGMPALLADICTAQVPTDDRSASLPYVLITITGTQ